MQLCAIIYTENNKDTFLKYNIEMLSHDPAEINPRFPYKKEFALWLLKVWLHTNHPSFIKENSKKGRPHWVWKEKKNERINLKNTVHSEKKNNS